jgi:serine/threonine protein phosphatase PrpC
MRTSRRLLGGDGPLFLLRDQQIVEKTRPHLLVDLLVAQGKLTAEQALVFPAKHVVVRVLGANEPAELTAPRSLLDGDCIVLCYRHILETATRLASKLAGSEAEDIVAAILEAAGTGRETAVVAITVRRVR